MRRPILAVLAAALATGCADQVAAPDREPTSAAAARNRAAGPLVYGLTADNELLAFDASKPNQVLATVAVTGLQPGERLVGIDFRPSAVAPASASNIGRLYGVGSASRIYTIDPQTGVATFVSTLTNSAGGGPIVLDGASFGVGFNPVPDRLRIHSDAGQNLRVNVDNGVTIVDGPLRYVDRADAPSLVGTGYTNNDNDPATGTVLYAIDARLDVLAIFDTPSTAAAPNAGTARVRGALGADTDAAVGFDIAFPGNTAYAALSSSPSGKSTLYTLDLLTGATTKLGLIAQSKAPLVAIAVAP